MEFKNIDRIVSWLDSTLKTPYGCYDLAAVLSDIERQYCNTGAPHYELAGWETISGNPECYNYDVETVYNEEEDAYEHTVIL